jgi:hypothetical protein
MSGDDRAAFQLVSEWSDFDGFASLLTSNAFRVFRGSRLLWSHEPRAYFDLVSGRTPLDTANGWSFD